MIRGTGVPWPWPTLAWVGLKRPFGKGRRAVALLPISEDAYYGLPFLWDLAAVHTMVGNTEEALDGIEHLLSCSVLGFPGLAGARLQVRSPSRRGTVPGFFDPLPLIGLFQVDLVRTHVLFQNQAY